MYGLVDQKSITACKHSTGAAIAIAAATFYITLSILVVCIPGTEGTLMNKIFTCEKMSKGAHCEELKGREKEKSESSIDSKVKEKIENGKSNVIEDTTHQPFSRCSIGSVMDDVDEGVGQSSDASTKACIFFQ
jgi:hypothetical protein